MDWIKLFKASYSKMKSRFEEIQATVSHSGLKGGANEKSSKNG